MNYTKYIRKYGLTIAQAQLFIKHVKCMISDSTPESKLDRIGNFVAEWIDKRYHSNGEPK